MSELISSDEEIATLRAENARLDEEIAELRAENARLRHQEDAQGMVRVLAPALTAVMPTRIEMKELLEAVTGRWPRDFEGVELDKFIAAFRALAVIHRQENLNSSHYAGHWVALANERLHGRGDTSYWPFLAAVVAWGDIALTDWRLKETEGVALEFSLNEFVGRLPTDQWRATLRGEFAKLIGPRPKRYLKENAPRPSFIVDGKPMPDSQRFTGPRYWNDF